MIGSNLVELYHPIFSHDEVKEKEQHKIHLKVLSNFDASLKTLDRPSTRGQMIDEQLKRLVV